ncbi:MAG: nuclear transport factor 2 family protein [Actinomycetota bacterium]
MTTLDATDRDALRDLAARYALAVDLRTFDDLRSVFTADASLDTGRSIREGIDQIVEAMHGLLRYEATSHVLGQQVVTIVDAEVHAVTYCTAHHLTADGETRTDKVMHIRYHDRIVRTADGWRIAARRLDVPWIDERPVG